MKANKAQKYLPDKGLDDIVINANKYPENKTENAKKWVYVSDVMMNFLNSQNINEAGHKCPYCNHISMQINDHFNHIEYFHSDKPLMP